MSDMVLLRARLADLKRTYREKNILAKGHVAELRNALDPYASDFSELRMGLARKEFQALSVLWDELHRLKEQTDEMERDLHG